MGQRTFKPKHRANSDRKFSSWQKNQGNLYDHAWEKYRHKYLSHNPRCYACGARSQVVDHLTPHKGDKTLFLKLDNHIPLCTKCHDNITCKFDMRYKPGNSISRKLEWIAYQRASRDLTFKVKVLPSYDS